MVREKGERKKLFPPLSFDRLNVFVCFLFVFIFSLITIGIVTFPWYRALNLKNVLPVSYFYHLVMTLS